MTSLQALCRAYCRGARWFARDNLVLDGAVGTGVHKGYAEMLATAGLTWTFGKSR